MSIASFHFIKRIFFANFYPLGYLTFFILLSCYPVQTRYSLKFVKEDEIHKTTEKYDSTSKIHLDIYDSIMILENNKSLTFRSREIIDTLVIDLTVSKINEPIENDEFERANRHFEKKEYQSALDLYLKAIKKFSMNNEMFWITQLKISDCLAEIGQIKECLLNLEQTFSVIKKDNPFRSQFIIKLAYYYCLGGELEKHYFYSSLLKKDYPQEIQILPKCE